MTGNTLQRVCRIVADHLGVERAAVTPDASIVSLGADSLDWYEIVMAIEDEFGIEIPDEDAEKITAAGQAATYVDQRLAAKAAT